MKAWSRTVSPSVKGKDFFGRIFGGSPSENGQLSTSEPVNERSHCRAHGYSSRTLKNWMLDEELLVHWARSLMVNASAGCHEPGDPVLELRIRYVPGLSTSMVSGRLPLRRSS